MTKLSRRDFFVTSSVALGTLTTRAWAQNPAAPAPPPTLTSFDVLRGNVGVFSGRGGFIGMLISPDGVVVVDSQFPDTAKTALNSLKQMTKRPIDLLINTHHHGDHTSGNIVFRPEVAKIAAINAKTEAQQAYPDTTFDQSWSTKLGSETVSGKYYGPGHTGGDIVVTFQNANIVHMGDLMSSIRHPRVDRPSGASVKGWVTILEAVTKEHPADTIYIAGHSKVNTPFVVHKANLLNMRDYFVAILDHTQKAIAAGKPLEEVAKLAVLPGFADYEGTPEPALRAAYEELTAKG
jgi:cyclase